MKQHAVAIAVGVATALVVSVITALVVSYGQGSEAIDELRIRAIVRDELTKADVGKIGDLELYNAGDKARDDAQQSNLERVDRFVEALRAGLN